MIKYKFTFVLLALFSMVLMWTACDKIEEPVGVASIQYSTDGYLDTLYFVDSVSITEKQVLLEDFTGHKCVNCPEAAIAAHILSESLNHRLIIYSVHAGNYAVPDETGDYTADYRCETSEQLYTDFQVFANPLALIDRTVNNGSRLILLSNWETIVMQELEKPNRINLKVRNIWYPNLGKVQTDIYTTFLNQDDDSLNLVVFIVEDSIVSPQKNNNPEVGPTPDWLDYVHRNILRRSLTTTYGGYVSETGNVTPNQEYHSQFIFTPDTAWETSHCKVITYIINQESGEIVQVAEAEIKTGEE